LIVIGRLVPYVGIYYFLNNFLTRSVQKKIRNVRINNENKL